jgi:hypothetical protein
MSALLNPLLAILAIVAPLGLSYIVVCFKAKASDAKNKIL